MMCKLLNNALLFESQQCKLRTIGTVRQDGCEFDTILRVKYYKKTEILGNFKKCFLPILAEEIEVEHIYMAVKNQGQNVLISNFRPSKL